MNRYIDGHVDSAGGRELAREIMQNYPENAGNTHVHVVTRSRDTLPDSLG